MKILLVSHFFPPFDHVASLRVGKTAKFLTRAGHEVRVLTARDQITPFRSLPVEIPVDRVHYTRWFSLPWRVDLALCRLFQSAESRVEGLDEAPSEFPAVSVAPDAGWQRTVLRGVERQGKRIRDTLRSMVYYPDTEWGWYPFAVREGVKVLSAWTPDVMLASGGPWTGFLVADRLSRRFGVPWVAELRDLWVDNHRYAHPAWRRRADDRLERRVLARASGFVTVSEPLADVLRAKYPAPIAVVYNGYDPDDFPASSTVPFRDGAIEIVYTGAITAGKQSPVRLFEAMRLLGADAERITVRFFRADRALVRQLAREQGVDHRVEALPAVPFPEAVRLQTTADVLLFLSWSDPLERGIVSGKLPQYMGACRPILAVGASDNEPADMIRQWSLGLASDDAETIAAQLRTWLAEKSRTGAIAGPAAATAMSREVQAHHLADFLETVVALPAHGTKQAG